jgi:hypothetical protein
MMPGVERERQPELWRALGIVAAVLLGLLAGLHAAPVVTHWAEKGIGATRLENRVIWGRSNLIGQFAVYLFALGMGLGGAAIAATPAWSSRVGRRGTAIAALLAIAVAAKSSWVLALIAVPILAVTAGVLAPSVGGGSDPAKPTPQHHLARAVLAAAGVALAWAVWLTLAERGPHIAWSGAAAALAIAGIAIAYRLRQEASEIDADVVGALPILLLPLLGLARAPSILWVGGALCGGLVLRAIARRWSWPGRTVAVFSVWSFAAITIIPLQLRDLPTVNHGEHEAQHLGWINSALHGRLLMADAGTTYPPLREYALLAYLFVTGVTIENVRVASIILNVAALAALLGCAWKISGRRWALLALAGYLLVSFSPLVFLLQYWATISLGWVDLVRTALPIIAIVGAAQALARAATWRKLAPWGALAGVSVLYSHEFGLCAVVAFTIAAAADFLFRSRPQRFAGIASFGGFAGGALAVIVVFVGVYAAFGRGRLLVRTFVEVLILAGAGVFGSEPFPVTAESFARPLSLLEKTPYGGLNLEFCFAPAIYIVMGAALLWAALRRRWTSEDTISLALLLFGVMIFRVPLAHADFWHLTSANPPAILGLVQFLARASRYAPRLGHLPIGSASVALVALISVVTGESRGAVWMRVRSIADGVERPQAGHQTLAGLARAGAVRVPDDTRRLVEFIEATTKPTDPIFCRIGFMTGPEIYFLADRENPTRFDVLAEIATVRQQGELADQLRRNPPVLVIGRDATYVGAEAAEVLDQGWTEVARFGEVVVARRR